MSPEAESGLCSREECTGEALTCQRRLPVPPVPEGAHTCRDTWAAPHGTANRPLPMWELDFQKKTDL